MVGTAALCPPTILNQAATSSATPITISAMPGQFTRRQRLLERIIRHALREQHLDQRQRAHIGGRRQRERQEPELRGERAHEAREHRGLPQSENLLEHVGRAKQQIDRQHQRLHEQAEHQRVGRRRHEGDAGHRDDGAAKADRREREASGGDQADDGRLQLRKPLFAARPQRGDHHADGRDHDRDHFQQRQMIAEKDEAEDRGLDRLGFQIRRRHHERAVVHRQQHQAGRDDLAQRAEQQPRPERPPSATARRRRSPRPRRQRR